MFMNSGIEINSAFIFAAVDPANQFPMLINPIRNSMIADYDDQANAVLFIAGAVADLGTQTSVGDNVVGAP